MPQLDKVTFLSQFFWLCLFYLSFYYLVLKYFLPKISRILTLRKRKMNLSQYGSNSLQQENHQVRENLDSLLSKGFSLSRNVFNDFLSRTDYWLNQSLTGINKTQYKTVNNSYIQSLGEASLSQNILLYYASTCLPETLKFKSVASRIRKLRKLRKSSVSSSQGKKIKNQTVSNQEATKKAKPVQEIYKRSRKGKK
jgi:F-type H+-transporting ATPase subunit b